MNSSKHMPLAMVLWNMWTCCCVGASLALSTLGAVTRASALGSDDD